MFFKGPGITTIIAVTVAVLAAPTPDPRKESNGMTIPLVKHSSSLNARNIDAVKSHVASHSAKIIRDMECLEKNTRTPALKRGESPQSSGAGVDLTYYENDMWYGTISVGTPAKSFTVQLDTGSSDLFIPALNGDENCRSHHNLWDPTLSSSAETLKRDFHVEFMDDAIAKGGQYTDNVTIAGFTADIQTIGAATTYSSEFAVSMFAPDGMLGLALPSLSAYPATPLFQTLFSEGKLPQPMFSFKLTTSGGEMYVGGMNEALYVDNSLAFTPVTNPGYWQVKIDNIKVNDRIVLTNVPAIIDTGANYIVGDPSQVLALHQVYGGKAFKEGFYTFPCSSFPSVTFTIGGQPYVIPASVLNKGRASSRSSDCFNGIVAPDDDRTFWSIGTLFLQLFYTVFDFGSKPPQVGFAMLSGPSS